MPRRQRWTPVRGTGTRVYDRADRWLLGASTGGPSGIAPGAFRGHYGGGNPARCARSGPSARPHGRRVSSCPRSHGCGGLPQARIGSRWAMERALARSARDEFLVWSGLGRTRERRDGLRVRRAGRALRAEDELADRLQETAGGGSGADRRAHARRLRQHGGATADRRRALANGLLVEQNRARWGRLWRGGGADAAPSRITVPGAATPSPLTPRTASARSGSSSRWASTAAGRWSACTPAAAEQ